MEVAGWGDDVPQLTGVVKSNWAAHPTEKAWKTAAGKDQLLSAGRP